MTTHVLKSIRLEELVSSPTNPRKTFDPLKLEEMARSIGEVGVLEPLLVRSLSNGHNGETAEQATRRVAKTVHGATYEVVAGERRYRAAKIASAAEVPCIVRELTDVQVLEIQIIENNQRDDVHPLEEAEGYAALMKSAGYDVAAIAGKIGRSEKYVYDRIKLLQLIPAAKKYFMDGEITAGHAIQLARLTKDDQEAIVGDGDTDVGTNYRITSIFVDEMSDPGLELDDVVCRKAISVRELAKLIDDRVRFRPDAVDLPNLFPATNAALKAAIEEELKIVKITRDYRVNDAARDEKERTYGSESWKRADGELEEGYRPGNTKKSKTCDHSVLGVVVAGHGRGEAFRVCVAKKKCTVHWAAEIKAANERGAPNGAGTKKGKAAAKDDWKAQERKRQEEYKRQDAERARWKKAAPRLREALVEKVAGAPIAALLDVVIDQCKSRWGGPAPKGIVRGSSLEQGVRYAAFVALEQEFRDMYSLQERATRTLKNFSVDAKKIVDEVCPPAPKEKPEKKAKPATKKKAAKP